MNGIDVTRIALFAFFQNAISAFRIDLAMGTIPFAGCREVLLTDHVVTASERFCGILNRIIAGFFALANAVTTAVASNDGAARYVIFAR